MNQRSRGPRSVPTPVRAALREVNERIRELEENLGERSYAAFFCECDKRDCFDKVAASLDEYRHVRSQPTRFLVRHGHVERRLERVVFSNGRFSVVEKFTDPGETAEHQS